ncbi:MAG: gliding motility-associated C-terminal domain-containing protein [Bacteroidota bacterium]
MKARIYTDVEKVWESKLSSSTVYTDRSDMGFAQITSRHVYLVLFVLSPILLIAQPETYNWYFGNQYGLNFSSGTPEEITDSAMRTFEGCAAVSDAEGNLLFYTNGGGRDPVSGQSQGAIWNRNNEIMYDMGFTEGGGWSSAQSSLIIPKPEQDSVYYLFTMEEVEFDLGGAPPDQPLGRGFSYFEVDMRLNDGLGDVSVADQRLYIPSYEGLAGTIHADGERYWILITDGGEEENDIFLRLLVDDSPIEATDIDSVIVEDNPFFGGPIKISPDGKWIGCAGHLFSFDNETGEIGFSAIYTQPTSGIGAFSPDSRYYYFWQTSAELARVDLLAADIGASFELLPTGTSSRIPGQMQLASNGNIYFITVDFSDMTTSVGEISCPSSTDPFITADLFNYMGTDEEPFFFGLPNFTDHLFSSPLADEVLAVEELVLCPNETLVLDARRNGQTYLWDTGETEASIEISVPGNYTVTITDACGGIVIDEKNVIEVIPPTISFDETLPLDTLCLDIENEITVLTEGGNTVQWSTGDTTNTVVLTGPTSTPLTVTVSNECGTLSQELTPEFIDCTLPDCEMVFPDVISPNGDGVNDLFGGFRNCPPSSYELRVYNRWGNMVFESNSIDNPWDGRFNGDLAPSDVYLYRAQYRFEETEDLQTAQGQLTIVR